MPLRFCMLALTGRSVLVRIAHNRRSSHPARSGITGSEFVPSASVLGNRATSYSIAVLASGLALLVSWLLSQAFGDSFFYLILFPAVGFAALFCGIGPSILAVVLAALGARYWFIQPDHSFAVPPGPQLAGLFAFLLVSSMLIVFAEINRRTTEQLRRTNLELEGRIKEDALQLDTAHQHVRDLTGQVLHLQDEERRRIARELHDSVGQSLAALAMNLSAVQTGVKGAIARLTETVSNMADSAAMVKDMSSEIRTISYLLHPPMLDEAGLIPAVRWYLQGFSERSNITVDLDVSENFERLSGDLETAIFRVVQECLTNIHRHSQSRVATIRLSRLNTQVEVEVRDQGKGIPQEKLSEIVYSGTAGVGIGGMRERARQLGGTLEVRSEGEGKGTVVLARLPVMTDSATVVAAALAAEP
jgi:signal transduction histidine kinase